MTLGDEREEIQALVDADRPHLLPKDALIASIKHLAGRLLELDDELVARAK